MKMRQQNNYLDLYSVTLYHFKYGGVVSDVAPRGTLCI